MRHFCFFLISLLYCQQAIAVPGTSSQFYQSREADPESILENVSVIHGDYSEIEVDFTVAAPDSLVLSRFYSSQDTSEVATLGGWRFNPHCHLSVQKDPKKKSYKTGEETFERTYVHVGNADGSILTYVGWQNSAPSKKHTLFKVDTTALANTARGAINAWTNQKNNELLFNSQNDSFELLLCSKGKRYYVRQASSENYLLSHEILPSGNKIFYEYNEQGQPTYIKETNAGEKKVLAWIKIQYGTVIHIETSDGKTADYHFKQDTSGLRLLAEVTRSDKPQLRYQYRVVENRALLVKKELPQGRFVQVDYSTAPHSLHKVKSITTPLSPNERAITQFSYEDKATEVLRPGNQKVRYYFDDAFQLTRIEQYLNRTLYRVHKKSWGKKKEASQLMCTSIEDGQGKTFYYKCFTYDDNGNIVEEREYGNLKGIASEPLLIDENGKCNQEMHVKTYSYFSGKNTYGFFQKDAKGAGIKFWYKNETNLLVQKFILINGSPDKEEEPDSSDIKQRYFYEYNEDAVLVRLTVDDGKRPEARYTHGASQRLITTISPKEDLPNIGAPGVVEQKYYDLNKKAEVLIKRTINQFDRNGNITSQALYDANGEYCYSASKKYNQGLLISETDPIGQETHYSYDANQNLIAKNQRSSGLTLSFEYDLGNRLTRTVESDVNGKSFETRLSYDAAGNKLQETDRFGNETSHVYDELGRLISTSSAVGKNEFCTATKATFTFAYDLFDCQISITDPTGKVTTKTYNVRGKPTSIHHPDGAQELFKYDSEGSLHRYLGRDGITQVYEYDYIGRLNHIEYYHRDTKGTSDGFARKYYYYNEFQMYAEQDVRRNSTKYTYDGAGRLVTSCKDNQKVEFIYDARGRTRGVKKWRTALAYTLEVREYDTLDRVIEERLENESGLVLVKSNYKYNNCGQLVQVIGYPHNQESILVRYEYDGFGRLQKIIDASGNATEISYDDAYLNQWGQRVQKRTRLDPIGNQTEEIFDITGNVVKTTKRNKAGKLIAESESSFDILGQHVAEKDAVISLDGPAKTYMTQWSFGQGNQLQAITGGKGALEQQTTTFSYNVYGDVIAQHSPAHKEPITYLYNPYGHFFSIGWKEDKKEIINRLSYDYAKNLTQVQVADSHTLTYTFDANNLPLSETVKDKFGTYQVTCSYNGEGKIHILMLPDGSSVEYDYDGPFVKKVTRLNKGKQELYNHSVSSRDLMGNILAETLAGHAGEQKQCWDMTGQRTEIITDFFQDKVPNRAFDALKNITKRETSFENESYTTSYEYNALSQLVAEKGIKAHSYTYDSIGNRLRKDGITTTINDANQLTDSGGSSYTFDLNGNLATKTTEGKSWLYRSNPLNQLTSIQTPNKNTITYAYDLVGRRLTKQVESSDKQVKVVRYFYLGQTEIGALDEKGIITELKIPSDPNNPEAAPCIAVELKGETYVPLYDLQGNIACLIDPENRSIAESYRYTAFGEEEIVDENGTPISESAIGNPWRYQGKRVDKETGLIYFGYRYYDPVIGRWTSPDPAGTVDGANLYMFARNNPMTYVDYFGLASEMNANQSKEFSAYFYGEVEPRCHCDVHRDCKRGGDISSRIGGVTHASLEFAIDSLHDLQAMFARMGAGQMELELHERAEILKTVETSQQNQLASLEEFMLDSFSTDATDETYQKYRSRTRLGLEGASLLAGGYGILKTGIVAIKAIKARILVSGLIKTAGNSENFISRITSLAGSKRAPMKYAPFQKIRNEAKVINRRTYTGHALDRMQDRGFMPSTIENTIKNGSCSPGKNPKTSHYYDKNNDISVITNNEGSVVTVHYGEVS